MALWEDSRGLTVHQSDDLMKGQMRRTLSTKPHTGCTFLSHGRLGLRW